MISTYVKFSVIIVAFLMANTVAVTFGLSLLQSTDSLLSLPGIFAIAGVLMANCAAIQLLLAGKYSMNPLFYMGLIPTIGYFIAFFLFTRTEQPIIAIILYSTSLIIGAGLLVLTMNESKNKKSLVL